jgi:hypothetical protein
LATILLQAALSVAVYLLYDVPVSSEVDSVEYIRTADNVLAGNGFSIELTAPWKPYAFRTPGPLLINIPLRILSFKSDLLAIIISRLLLLAGAVLTIYLASRLGLSSFSMLAATFFVAMPSMAYYSLLPYSTETPYAVACGLLFASSLAYLNRGTWKPLAVIGLAAMYALWLRPAALFVLTAYLAAAVFIALRHRYMVRQRVLFAACACFLGIIVAYGVWGYRNYKTFGTFQYSTISGDALLDFNARLMEPYLDETGKRELESALVKYPRFLQRYSEFDQFVISNREAEEALRLIFKYPLPFLQSHFEGVLRSFFVFAPNILKNRSQMLVVAASIVHSGLAAVGIWGLAAAWKSFSEPNRLALLLMLTVGAVSALTVGAPASPRFRIPFDVLFSVGCALFVARAKRIGIFHSLRRGNTVV